MIKIPRGLLEKAVSFFILISGFIPLTHAQSPQQDKKSAQQALVRNLVESRNYVFNAQTAIPLGGRTRQLDGGYYDLKITQDAIVCYLPYFGRAYQAPLDPSQSGIQFSSKKFEYTATPRKKGGWDIQIKTNDTQEPQRIDLTITEDGYATLQAGSASRQSINFNGTITAPKQKKP